MSKEMREQIDRVKNWKKSLNESEFDDLHGDVHGSFDINDTNVDKIIEHIQSLPNSYRLKTSFGDTFTLYGSGIDTALNNGMITHFYLSYLRKNKKRTKILPTPNLNSDLYEKLNDLIKQCDLYKQPEETRTNSLMSLLDVDKKDMNNRLFRAMCFQMMNILLYEDFFGVDFRYGNGHKIIHDLVLPNNEDEYYELFHKWNGREDEVRNMLFYADAIPVVSIIENFS
jgi:hypothetical protein